MLGLLVWTSIATATQVVWVVVWSIAPLFLFFCFCFYVSTIRLFTHSGVIFLLLITAGAIS